MARKKYNPKKVARCPSFIAQYARASNLLAPMRNLHACLSSGEILVDENGVPQLREGNKCYAFVHLLRDWCGFANLVLPSVDSSSLEKIAIGLECDPIEIHQRELNDLRTLIDRVENELRGKTWEDTVTILKAFDATRFDADNSPSQQEEQSV